MDSWRDEFIQKKVRSDLAKVFVMSKGMNTKQLEEELRGLVIPELEKGIGESKAEIYVVQRDLTERPSFLNHEVKIFGHALFRQRRN